MSRRDLALVAVLFAVALGLRAYDLAYPPFPFADEAGHVPAATHYWQDGQFEPDFWEHPPLRHVLLYGFLKLLGDNPYGWRMRNVLFGALAAALTYLLVLAIGGDRRAAFLAGALLATDPLHVVTSRYTYEEIYGGAFFLASVVLWVVHRQRSLWLVLSALCMGLALATKWYYVPGWLLILLLSLRENGNYRVPATAAFVASTWLLVPLTVYLLSYYPWFGRGYALPELVEHVVSSYRSLQSLSARTFGPELVFLRHPSSLEWFVAPVVGGQGAILDGGRGEFVILMNDLPIWALALPATILTAVVALRRRTLPLALPALLFFATYAIFLVARRPAFVYSAVPLLPFAFAAIGLAVTWAADRYGPKLYWAILAAAVAWSGFLYPLVTARRIPVALYRFVLDGGGIRLL